MKHGKEAFSVPGVDPQIETVGSLKRRLSELPGMTVPCDRMRLIFKGELADGATIASTKLKDGAKITLMAPSSSSAKR